MRRFPHFMQTDSMTCGPACLKMVATYYGKNYSLDDLVRLSRTDRSGSSLLGLCNAAENLGFRASGAKITFSGLTTSVKLPCIIHWNNSHFVVVYKIDKKFIHVSDPSHGQLKYTHDEFTKSWLDEEQGAGISLILETTPEFYQNNPKSDDETRKKGFPFLFGYLLKHKKPIIQVLLGLLLGSILQLIFPFLTQNIIDKGIRNKDIGFIYLILFAQLMVFSGRTTIEVIRSYILMRVSNDININLARDFFSKLMRLPIRYFDTKMTGDIMQRIDDNHRIENFLTGSSLNTLFSMLSFIVFSIVLAWYSFLIFAVFFIGTLCYFLWILFFMKRRADLDYKRFNQSSINQSKILELINGMQEIKLHNAETQKRRQWEVVQTRLFEITLKSLSLSNVQNTGSSLINELKNIIITFIAARLVLDNHITLGMMLSVSYITGQLNSPVLEMVNFIQRWQDAKLSLERLNEIHQKEEEDAPSKSLLAEIPEDLSLHFEGVSFSYGGAANQVVLEDISVQFPAHKVTAIVGSSGSGKSTLMKLLLQFYAPTSGDIFLSSDSGEKKTHINLSQVQPHSWRAKTGVVLQEGYIFNDTIAGNIAVGEETIDYAKLEQALRIANIHEFIKSLPHGYNTRIGLEGNGISTGQKQRILIARAVYKNPQYLFFDEATSALDANNEKTIMNNLNQFYKNKTVIVIAHRLSTVKNADQIIVLDKGKIIERGNHKELSAIKGAYYELVKNQLELGS